MNSDKQSAERLHARALEVVGRYKASELELLEILNELDFSKAFYVLGYSSLFKYATDALGLSEDIAYIFISVARKSREVPALKNQIACGAITVSKAKRLTAVITQENQEHWLQLAKESSKRELEKQIVLANPSQLVEEREQLVLHAVTEATDVIKTDQTVRVQLQIGVSEKLMLRLRRAQDVLSQKRRCAVSLEEVVSEITDLFLCKMDPLEKARFGSNRREDEAHRSEGSVDEPKKLEHCSSHEELGPGPVQKANASQAQTPPPRRKRRRISRSVRRSVIRRDGGQCAHVDPLEGRCPNRRFLEIHHRVPLSAGGTNNESNLVLLCSGHHKVMHVQMQI